MKVLPLFPSADLADRRKLTRLGLEVIVLMVLVDGLEPYSAELFASAWASACRSAAYFAGALAIAAAAAAAEVARSRYARPDPGARQLLPAAGAGRIALGLAWAAAALAGAGEGRADGLWGVAIGGAALVLFVVLPIWRTSSHGAGHGRLPAAPLLGYGALICACNGADAWPGAATQLIFWGAVAAIAVHARAHRAGWALVAAMLALQGLLLWQGGAVPLPVKALLLATALAVYLLDLRRGKA